MESLLCSYICYFRPSKWTFAAVISCLVTFFIAMLDEYHQTFVDGRTGVFDDVSIDTAGAITFIFCLKDIFFYKIFVESENLIRLPKKQPSFYMLGCFAFYLLSSNYISALLLLLPLR